jgi:hypothetical protein
VPPRKIGSGRQDVDRQTATFEFISINPSASQLEFIQESLANQKKPPGIPETPGVWLLDCLARSLKQLIALIEDLDKRGIHLIQ